MAVSVDASAWHDYESGIFDGGNHTNPDLDHLVQLVGMYMWTPWTFFIFLFLFSHCLLRTFFYLTQGLVGYGKEDGKGYWTVRNSWTPLWGEKGYIRLARHALGKHCGVDITPLHGSGCDGGPDKVEVCGQNGILYDAVFPTV